MDKRCRGSNYTFHETEMLISLVEKYRDVIENKQSDVETWKKKEEYWGKIEKEFNTISAGVFRSKKHLRSKYECVKKEVRRKQTKMRQQLYKMEAGTAEMISLTPNEKRMNNSILNLGDIETAYNEEENDKDVIGTAERNQFLEYAAIKEEILALQKENLELEIKERKLQVMLLKEFKVKEMNLILEEKELNIQLLKEQLKQEKLKTNKIENQL